MIQRRFSPKREAILQNLRSRFDHPTAQQVHAALQESLPNLSLATVYRNLGELAEEGTILSLTVDGETHYDGHLAPHYHLACVKCGVIEDVHGNAARDFLQAVESEEDCMVLSAELVVRCRCRSCAGLTS
ncbi:MAG: transcriptional repressor [Clostridia bacterium]|nr:transcriptional repressor [Clostridia bacterium]